MSQDEPMQEKALSVLLIEDQPDDAALILRRLARQTEFPVTTKHVSTLAAALGVLGGQQVDIVLLDLSLEDSQGLPTVRSILRTAPASSVIVLSGCDDMEIARQAVHEGAQDFLLKVSWDKDLLARAIRYAIERNRQKQDLSAALETTRREVEARRQVEEALRKTAAELSVKAAQVNAANETLTDFLTDGDYRGSSQRMLDRALRLTDSPCGVLGIVTRWPTLRLLGYCRPAGLSSDDEQAFVSPIVKSFEENDHWDLSLDSSTSSRLSGCRAPVVNEGGESWSPLFGLPPGHLAVSKTAVIPIVQRDEFAGLLLVANRKDPYGPNELNTLSTLASVAGVIHESYRRQQDQRALAERLGRVERLEAVNRVAGKMAHEFNEVLSKVVGYLSFLSDSIPKSAPMWKDAQTMMQTAAQAASLSSQLMEISRRQTVKPRVLDLNEVISLLREKLETFVPSGSALALVLDSNPTSTLIDQRQLEQIVVELISNARDAIVKPGVITISTHNVEVSTDRSLEQAELSPGAYVVFSVQDTGVGMDEETKLHVFEPLFSTKGPIANKGMGLAGVYRFVRHAGGSIVITSTVGSGTKVDVYLRRFELPFRLSQTSAPPVVKVERQTILVVDDDQDLRGWLTSVLTKAGYVVLTAPNGNEASSILANHAEWINVLLTDITMPGMNGHDLAEFFLKRHPGAHVLFVTGVSEGEELPMVKQGRSRLFHKPIRAQELIQSLRDLFPVAGQS